MAGEAQREFGLFTPRALPSWQEGRQLPRSLGTPDTAAALVAGRAPSSGLTVGAGRAAAHAGAQFTLLMRQGRNKLATAPARKPGFSPSISTALPKALSLDKIFT